MNERGRIICQRVTRRIGEVAPKGLGRWPGTWDIVEASTDAFLDRLAEWEASDTPNTRVAVEKAVSDFVGAWRRAAEAWEAAGFPVGREQGRVPDLAGGVSR